MNGRWARPALAALAFLALFAGTALAGARPFPPKHPRSEKFSHPGVVAVFAPDRRTAQPQTRRPASPPAREVT